MPDRTKTNFTPNQRAQVAALFDAGCVSRETAKGGRDLSMCMTIVIGILRDKGLADSRTVKPKGGSQFTAYWLTDAGVELAKEGRS